MRTPRVLLGSLATTAAAVTLLAAATVPASAATGPYNVQTGTKTTGTSPVSGTNIGSLVFHDIQTNQDLNCPSGSNSGTIINGAHAGTVAGAKLGSIASSTFNNCTGALNLVIAQVGTWNIAVTKSPVVPGGANPTDPILGKITNINTSVQDTSGACKFNVTGQVPIRLFQQAPVQKIVINTSAATTTQLVISNVNGGCFGLVNNGDKVTFKATYKITSTDGRFKITN